MADTWQSDLVRQVRISDELFFAIIWMRRKDQGKMTVVLRERRDLTTANYLRVAWRGEPIELAEAALLHMADTRKAFLALLEGDPDIVVYGTTSAGGDQARFQLSREEREARGRLTPRRGTSWGEPFPERVVRGIVFARLANWLDGHGAVRPELAVAVASLLDGRPLPHVPMTGNGGSGEVIALGHLFSCVAGEVGGTELKEPMELVNGSPCAVLAQVEVDGKTNEITRFAPLLAPLDLARAVAAGIAFPHAAQAIQIRRRRKPLNATTRWSTETAYAIISLTASQATPAQLAAWIRGHWGIEALHHIRDVTYGEDASQARTRNGPQVMATLRNLGIGILKLSGCHNIAAACRYHARDATRALATLGLTPT